MKVEVRRLERAQRQCYRAGLDFDRSSRGRKVHGNKASEADFRRGCQTAHIFIYIYI